MIQLRPYQQSGNKAILDCVERLERRILLVLPTGGGKTVSAAGLIRHALESGQRVLFVAHRRELIHQTFCKLVRFGLRPDQIGIIMAGTPRASASLFPRDPDALSDFELVREYCQRRSEAPIQVASLDTLRLSHKPRADWLFFDEAHRSLAPSYLAVASLYPEAVLVGLTATPYRADKRGLCELYGSLIVGATPSQLVAAGAIVEPEAWTVPQAFLPELAGVKMKAGDYDEEELQERTDRVELVGNIVEHWIERAGNRRTVVFASGVAHSMHIAQRFVSRGVAAEHLDGTTPSDVRDAILGRLLSGETRVVSNCAVLIEGWDMPAVKCAVLARPTRSLGLYLQMAGRILRPWESTGAILLDHAGVMMQPGFGSPVEDRDYTLEGSKRKARELSQGEPPPMRLRTCLRCYAMVPVSKRTCPHCGYEAPAPTSATKPEGSPEADAKLVRFRPTRNQITVEEWKA
jgi:DNA repair protein RadD